MVEESGLVALQSDPRPAVTVFLAYGRGEHKDFAKLAQAGVHLILYGLYEFSDKPSVLQALKAPSGQPKMQEALSTPNEVALALAEKFRDFDDSSAGKANSPIPVPGSPIPVPGQGGGFDWSAIFPLIIQLIQLLLKAKTV